MNSRVSTFLIDCLAIFLFAVLARLAHNSAEMPFTFINVLDTYWPFLAGVILGTALIKNEENPRAVGAGAIVWIATVIVGLAVWATRHSEFPHWSFILVASTMSALLLLGWRAAANAVSPKSADRLRKEVTGK